MQGHGQKFDVRLTVTIVLMFQSRICRQNERLQKARITYDSNAKSRERFGHLRELILGIWPISFSVRLFHYYLACLAKMKQKLC